MKKLLPVLLCAAMLLCLLPLEARAAAAAWDGTVDISWYDPAQTEYTIDTPAKLAGLAALVNGMADPAAKAIVGDRSYLVSKKVDNVMLVGAGGGNVFDTVYTGGVDFAYKTIYLTADLDMGGRKAADGSWTGPNWTPIGGKFPMKPQEASGDCLTLDTRFNGVLDGQGHTIYNLYCDRYAAKGFPYSMAVGVVGFLGGNADYANGGNGEKTEAEFENGWQPAVRNLVLGSGSIYGAGSINAAVEQAQAMGCHVLAAVNTDFFSTATGVPIGLVIADGVYQSSAEGRSALVFSDGQALLKEDPQIELTLVNQRTGRQLAPQHLNKRRTASGGLYLLNGDFSTVSTRTGRPSSSSSTVTWLLPSGRSQLSSPLLRTAARRRHRAWAMAMGAGISSGVSSQA